MILGRRRPLNLGRLLRRSATSEEERYDAEDNAWEVLDPKYRRRPLLEFEWESGGPMSSFAGEGEGEAGVGGIGFHEAGQRRCCPASRRSLTFSERAPDARPQFDNRQAKPGYGTPFR